MPRRNAVRLTKRIIEGTRVNSIIWDIEQPGFGLRTTEKGHRSFVFQYRSRSGTQGKIVLGHFPSMTVEEARRLARQHRANVDSGGNPSLERQSIRSAPTMADMIEYYTGEYARTRGLKSQTASEMRQLLDRFVRPTLGQRKVADISPTDIRRVHGTVKNDISPYRANKLLAGLSRIFNLAKADQIRLDNPCYGIRKFPEDQRTKYLGQSEVVRLLGACDCYPDKQAANAIRLLLLTGARLREVLHATWSQFDLGKGMWTKPSHHTKTKIVHEVRLGDTVVVILKGMEREKLSPFLFPGRTLDAPRTDLKRPWRAIQQAAGLSGYRLHDLRRTYASFLLNNGSDLGVVGKLLGHTQPSTTQRYARLFTETERDAANKAASALMPLRIVS